MRLSAPARELVSVINRHRLNYDTFRKAAFEARRHAGLRPSGGSRRRLPQLIPPDAFRRFYEALDGKGDIKHQIMLRLLFYAGLRVSELVQIEMADVNLQESKIFIRSGKGDKDRYVLMPDRFRLALQGYMAAHSGNRFLFESNRKTKCSTRMVQKLVARYAAESKIPVKVHPHLFRHQLLTYLTAQGLSDAQIQLISGHASKTSLEVYQHLSLSEVGGDYQEAMRKLEI